MVPVDVYLPCKLQYWWSKVVGVLFLFAGFVALGPDYFTSATVTSRPSSYFVCTDWTLAFDEQYACKESFFIQGRRLLFSST